MRLGLYHEPVHTDGRTFDTYGPYARYILEFAKHFDHVTVFAPTTDQPTYFSGTAIDADNVTVVPLPFFTTHAQAYMRSPAITMAFHRHCRDLDVINCRGTAPLGYVLWYLTRRQNAPFLYHFSSDPFEMIAKSPKYKGLYGRFAYTAYSFEFSIQKYIMRRNYSFTDGAAISERLRRYTPHVEPIILSSLQEDDYYLRDDSCTGAVIRILYVGYLRQGKGLEDLVDAVAILRGQGRNVVLDLVGTGEMQPVLTEQVKRLKLDEHVRFLGYVVMGPALNACYNSADLFALPSLSEGSPRVIIEAMGHSLPVVATAVGNIAEMLDNGRRGVLVPQKDPAGLAAGIARVIDEHEFRRQCIREGHRYARQHGLPAFVTRMSEKAQELVEARRRGENR